MSAVIEADGLGKRYRRQWALTDCTLSVPAGHVVGLVGPNGAGKTTLLSLAVGCHGGSCVSAPVAFLNRLQASSPYPVVYLLGIGLILVAPAVIGIFWGAPLIARELETRTFTLAWNQSITRTRWLVVKLALTGLAAMAVTEALSLMYAWWADPIGKATGLGASTCPPWPSPWPSSPPPRLPCHWGSARTSSRPTGRSPRSSLWTWTSAA